MLNSRDLDGQRMFKQPVHHETLSRYKRAFLLSRVDPSLQTQYRCLFNLGAEYVAVGKTKKGLKCLLRCMKLQKQSSWEDDGDLYLNIGLAYEGLQRQDKALPFLQQAVRSFTPNSPASLGDTLIKLSYCWISQGEKAVAGKSFAQAAKAYRQAGRREDAAMALREAAKYAILSLEASESRVVELLQGCLQDSRDEGCDVKLRGVLEQGNIENCQDSGPGGPGLVIPDLNHAEQWALRTRIENHGSRAGQLLIDVGLHYCTLGRFGCAEACFLEALSACNTQTNEAPLRAVLLQNLGAVKNAQGLFSCSLPYHTEAVQLFGVLGRWRGEGESLANLAYAYSQMSLFQLAVVCYQAALKSLRRAGDLRGQCLTCEGLAATLFSVGAFRQAISTYQHSLDLLEGSEVELDIVRKRIERKMTTIESIEVGT